MENINEKYSYKDFTNRDFSKEDVKEFNDTTIIGSCFYREATENQVEFNIFPEGMTGVHFIRCNLDNIIIPKGNTVLSEGGDACQTRRIKMQNDLDDWILDAELKPIEPISKKLRLANDISIDHLDIPLEKLSINILKQ